MDLILIGVGGFFGAIARYLVDGWVSGSTRIGAFPLGTFVINISGAFTLGLLFALALEKTSIDPRIRGPVMIGFLGAYTTFSTLMLESWRLAEDGSWGLAMLNVGLSGAVGLCAVFAGLTLGRALA
ncbi:MAG TPA: fluoride efflux transporter CrcB [Candidatus Limnocylindrales bacterium]